MIRDAAAAARPEQPLSHYKQAVGRAYLGSAGVVTDPAPPHDPWPRVEAALRARGPRLRGLLALTAAERVVLPVLVDVTDGLVTGVRSPELATVAEADDVGAGLDLYARLDWEEAMAALGAPESVRRPRCPRRPGPGDRARAREAAALLRPAATT